MNRNALLAGIAVLALAPTLAACEHKPVPAPGNTDAPAGNDLDRCNDREPHNAPCN